MLINLNEIDFPFDWNIIGFDWTGFEPNPCESIQV